MAFVAKKAKRTRRPLKISMEGVSGGGKTLTALIIGHEMVRLGIAKRIVVIDSENESAGLYAGMVIHGLTLDYDTVDMPADKRNPAGYSEAYDWAVGQGYDVVIFDSLSHAWHGALELVDQIGMANRGDKLKGWAMLSPQQRTMIQTITDPRAHCIVTMRVKSDMQQVEGSNGKTRMQKVGMKADQRDNTEYEFDLVLRFEAGNEVRVDKVRGCSAMADKVAVKPGPAFLKPLFDWWKSGDDAEPAPAVVVEPKYDDALFADLKQRLAKCEDKDALMKAKDDIRAAVKAGTLSPQHRSQLVTQSVAVQMELAKTTEDLGIAFASVADLFKGNHISETQHQWLTAKNTTVLAKLTEPS
jgi:hypothetical protein